VTEPADFYYLSVRFLTLQTASRGNRSMGLMSAENPGARRRLGVSALLSALILAASTQPTSAQSIVRGDLSGVVVEVGGGALPGVAVSATEAATGAALFFESDRSGRFGASLLQAGEYDVLAEAPGFLPKLVRGVQLRAGQTASVTIELEAAPPPVVSVDTVFAGGGASPHFDALGSHWISGAEIAAYSNRHLALEGLSSLSSVMDESLGSEGLPGASTAIFWDGIPFTPARHPASLSGPALPIVPRIGLANVDVHRRTDVEWSGGAGGSVAAISRPSANTLVGEVYGAASTGALWQADSFSDLDVPSATSLWGGGSVSLPFTDGNTRIFVGVEGERVETPRTSPFTAELAGRLVAAGPPAPGVEAADLSEPFVTAQQALSGLARVDWTSGTSTEVSARVGFATASIEGAEFFGPGLAYGSTAPQDATDASAGITVLAEVSELVTLEIRVGGEYSSRQWAGTLGGGEPSAVPPTQFAEAGARIGPEAALVGEVSRSAVVGSPIAHFRLSEAHSLKVGFTFSVPSYEYSYVHGSAGDFLFDRPEDIAGGQAVFFQSSGAGLTRSFTVGEWGLIAQHRWEPRAGVRVTTGLRHDQEKLPVGDVPSWADLTEATGLDNRGFAAELRKTSPRFAVELDLSGDGRTVVEGAISATYDQLDPGALNDVMSLSGSVTARRQFGGLSQWPDLPSSGGGSTSVAQMVGVLGPKLRAPRTARATLGISQALGTSATLHVVGTVRRTEFLLRRSDVNLALAPAAVGTDDGRPIFGTLRKIGSVVAPDPGSNRRFANYDVIWGLSADGWSDYRALTVAFEYASVERVGLFGSYTLSSTEDNLLGARAGDPYASIAPRIGADASTPWEHGTSDFDVPHRLSVGLTSRLPILQGVEASAAYRFRSGWAYTPGYGLGADVNGDGSGSNDPAFVPQNVAEAGLADLDCLVSDLGRIATRNSCRGPNLHSLDAHFSVGLFRLGGTIGQLTLDLFNVLDADLGLPDAALLLVEPNQPLEQGPGTARVPTRVNPAFGTVTNPLHPGRMFRVGFRIVPT